MKWCSVLVVVLGCRAHRAPPPIVDARVAPDAEVVHDSQCDPLTSYGCNPDDKCALVAGVPTCVRDGTLALGDACDAADDQCPRGSECRDGACYAFCARDIFTGSGACERGLCGIGAPETCSTTCDPAAPSCTPGLECFLPLESGTPGCLAPGTAAEGMPCNHPNDCGSGLTCTVKPGGARCVPR